MDSLCRVCIKRTDKCTLLNSKIEDSSNLSYLGFLNRCTSLNVYGSDSLPQTLCEVCVDSMKTFYEFVKLAETSDKILRETLKNLRAKGKYKGSGEISCEEITIKKKKIKGNSEDFNQSQSFHCQPSENSTEPIVYTLDIVKEEPQLSESTSIAYLKDGAVINKGEIFESHPEHPKGTIQVLDDSSSCIDRRAASIDARHNDEAPISLQKNKLGKNEDEIDTRNKIFFEAPCIPSKVKKKTDEKGPKTEVVIKQEPLDPESIIDFSGFIENSEISCEGMAITNEKVEEDSFHCQPNSTGSSLVILDIVKEEPRLSEGTSIADLKGAEMSEGENFEYDLNHPEKSIEEPDDILSSTDHRLGGLDTEHTASEDDLPVRKLGKGWDNNGDDANSQRNSCEEITIKNKTQKHGCEICGKQFCTKLYLKEHIKYHKGFTPKCNQCGKEFTHNHSLRKHMKLHSPTSIKYEEKCKICGRIFATKYYLNIHMESHGGIIQKCNKCGKEYNNSRSLRNHMKWHENPTAFACENCGKFFAWRSNYNRHMDICKRPGEPRDLNATKVECKICGKKVSSKQYLNFHMESHNGIMQKCQKCDKEYDNTIALRNHMKLHTNPKLFECKICGKPLSSKNNYTKHMEICKRPDNQQLNKRKYKCQICGKQLCSPHYRNKHIMKNHKGITQECEQCGKECLTAKLLRRHMKRHAPFKCVNCKKVFNTWSNYQRHLCKLVDIPLEETVTIEKPSLSPKERIESPPLSRSPSQSDVNLLEGEYDMSRENRIVE